MVQAYILVQTEVGKAAEVAIRIGELAGVTQAEDVTGPYDVIVRAEAENVDSRRTRPRCASPPTCGPGTRSISSWTPLPSTNCGCWRGRSSAGRWTCSSPGPGSSRLRQR